MSSPNILLFLTDDHAHWALGCYGNAGIRTPALDYLAKTGVQMNNAFTPTPVCSPARACLHTGRLASQHGIHDYLATGDPTINARNWLGDEVTLAQLLQKAGYRTAQIGKWHLGQDEVPHAGYDEWFTLGRGYPIIHGGAHEYGFDGEHHSIEGRITHVVQERASQFLNSRDAHVPFFLTVGFYATHSPWEGQAEWLVESYRGSDFAGIPDNESFLFGTQNLESTNSTRHNPREALAQYYAAVTEIDTAVGRLLDQLEAIGQLDNTLIIYTSDHGLNCGHHGIWGKGNGTLPLNMVEESIRIPLILRHPASFAGGRQCEEFVDHLDTFQTILDVASVGVDGGDYAGISYLPLLQNQPIPHWRTAQFCEYGTVRMVRTDRYKLVSRLAPEPTELFDLQTDPREMVNLFTDPAYQALVQQLTHQLDTYFTQYEDPHYSGLRGRELPQTNFSEAWRS